MVSGIVTSPAFLCRKRTKRKPCSENVLPVRAACRVTISSDHDVTISSDDDDDDVLTENSILINVIELKKKFTYVNTSHIEC